jgi:hypothetical protein
MMDSTVERTMPSIVFESNRLKVEIALPGTVYRRSRFDWAGFITQITLDGRHTFCVPEDYDPAKGTGGIGLCSEFGNEKAIGYADAAPGETFPKLGIGLLKRPEDPKYNFFKPHEIAEPFPIEIETGPDSVQFTVQPLDCRGYAVREIKTVSAAENWLTIETQLENCGSKAVHTHEYCHNFIGINRQPVGPDYHLRFPYPLAFEKFHESYRSFLPPLLRKITPGFVLEMMVKRMMGSGILRATGNEIDWKATPEKFFFCRPLGSFKTEEAQWELTHRPSKICVREFDDFTPVRVALWGAAHVVSAEVYTDIDLEPGERTSWTRRYQFIA